MNLHNLRGRLPSLAARAPSAPTGRMLTSEQAIREVQALVNEMQVAGAVVPLTNEAISPEQEAALIARALAEVDAELGQGCRNRSAVAQRRQYCTAE